MFFEEYIELQEIIDGDYTAIMMPTKNAQYIEFLQFDADYEDMTQSVLIDVDRLDKLIEILEKLKSKIDAS